MLYAHATLDMQADAAAVMDAIVTPVQVELPAKDRVKTGPKGSNHLHQSAPNVNE